LAGGATLAADGFLIGVAAAVRGGAICSLGCGVGEAVDDAGAAAGAGGGAAGGTAGAGVGGEAAVGGAGAVAGATSGSAARCATHADNVTSSSALARRILGIRNPGKGPQAAGTIARQQDSDGRGPPSV
jgi:hypothetical protein